MTKPVIVTRETKGTPLTRAELDSNFTNLDNATIGVAGDAGTPISANLNDTITINGGNGIGTAVVDGDLVVNLNGVYGGNATSSTTVGNNTAVLLAPVATSGSYNDLTDKPAAGGNNIVIIGSAGSDPGSLNFNTNSSISRPTDNFRLIYSGGVSGVSVSSNTFTLPAGTYVFELPWIMSSGVPFRLTKGPNYDFASRVLDDYNSLVIQTSSGGAIGGSGNGSISPGVTTQFTLTGSTSLSFYKNGNSGNDYMSLLDRSNMLHSSIMFKFIKIS
jgi:hypothetical protein